MWCPIGTTLLHESWLRDYYWREGIADGGLENSGEVDIGSLTPSFIRDLGSWVGSTDATRGCRGAIGTRYHLPYGGPSLLAWVVG